MWWLYILRCSDGSFYTGISNDLELRLQVHNSGKASKYTRCRRPVVLIYSEEHATKGEALKREAEIKRLNRKQKEHLVERR